MSYHLDSIDGAQILEISVLSDEFELPADLMHGVNGTEMHSLQEDQTMLKEI